MSYHRFWAKSDRSQTQPYRYRLFADHVSAVTLMAGAFLEHNPLTLRTIRDVLSKEFRDITEPQAKVLAQVSAALHDLGKLSDFFQRKHPGLYQELHGHAPHLVPSSATWEKILHWNHGVDGYAWAIRSNMIKRDTLLDFLLRCGSVHHGNEPDWTEVLEKVKPMCDPDDTLDIVVDRDVPAAQAFIKDVLDWAVDQGVPRRWFDIRYDVRSESEYRAVLAELLAQVVAVSDWLGSEEVPFSLTDKAGWQTTSSYPRDFSQSLAYVASHCNVNVSIQNHGAGINQMIPNHQFTEFPLMQAQTTIRDNRHPFVIVELPTGDGKTEAAFAAFLKDVEAGFSQRLIFAMPTKASANLLYERIRDYSSKAFRGRVRDILKHQDSYEIVYSMLEADEKAGQGLATDLNVPMLKWAANGKKALLSQVVVCTIDQLAMGVLQGHNHSFVRTACMTGATVVVDEVHGLDMYLTILLNQILRFLGRTQTRTIFLSATLNDEARRNFCNVYSRKTKDYEGFTKDYMNHARMSYVDVNGDFHVIPLKSRRKNSKLRLSLIRHTWGSDSMPSCDDERATARKMKTWFEEGRCSVWIRNTVRDAQSCYDTCLRVGIPKDNILLLHASLNPIDRKAVEDAIMQNVGVGGPRNPMVVIATDVLGTSCDLDFDEMIRDLTTFDRLIQAAGRLHRHPITPQHKRNKRRKNKMLHIYMPDDMGAKECRYDITHTETMAYLYATWYFLNEKRYRTIQDPVGIRPIMNDLAKRVPVIDPVNGEPRYPDPHYDVRQRRAGGRKIMAFNEALLNIRKMKVPLSDLSPGGSKTTRYLAVNKPVFVGDMQDGFLSSWDGEGYDASWILALDPDNPADIRRLAGRKGDLRLAWFRLIRWVRKRSATHSRVRHGVTDIATNPANRSPELVQLELLWEKASFDTMFFLKNGETVQNGSAVYRVTYNQPHGLIVG